MKSEKEDRLPPDAHDKGVGIPHWKTLVKGMVINNPNERLPTDIVIELISNPYGDIGKRLYDAEQCELRERSKRLEEIERMLEGVGIESEKLPTLKSDQSSIKDMAKTTSMDTRKRREKSCSISCLRVKM